MVRLSKRCIAPLLLCSALVGAMAPGFATHVAAAAPATPAVALKASLQSDGLFVTGSNFQPGAKVTIDVLHPDAWRLVTRITTHAQPLYRCSLSYEYCRERNPDAGMIFVRIPVAPVATKCSLSYAYCREPVFEQSPLLVLYRSLGRIGFGQVALPA